MDFVIVILYFQNMIRQNSKLTRIEITRQRDDLHME